MKNSKSFDRSNVCANTCSASAAYNSYESVVNAHQNIDHSDALSLVSYLWKFYRALRELFTMIFYKILPLINKIPFVRNSINGVGPDDLTFMVMATCLVLLKSVIKVLFFSWVLCIGSLVLTICPILIQKHVLRNHGFKFRAYSWPMITMFVFVVILRVGGMFVFTFMGKAILLCINASCRLIPTFCKKIQSHLPSKV